MEKVLLANIMALGDVIVLSGALRDLHRCYPGRFQTGMRTYFPDVWRHNPYVASASLDDPETRLVPCTYPLVHQCNERPVHLLDGFIEEINRHLGTAIRPTALKGDLYLSDE